MIICFSLIKLGHDYGKEEYIQSLSNEARSEWLRRRRLYAPAMFFPPPSCPTAWCKAFGNWKLTPSLVQNFKVGSFSYISACKYAHKYAQNAQNQPWQDICNISDIWVHVWIKPIKWKRNEKNRRKGSDLELVCDYIHINRIDLHSSKFFLPDVELKSQV